MSDIRYYIGIDGGGTKCHARIRDLSGNLIGEAHAGAANINTNAKLTRSSILEAVKMAFCKTLQSKTQNQDTLCTAMAQSSICLSLAGSNLVTNPLATLKAHGPLPFSSILVEQDIMGACRGAFKGANGWLGITGTGSAFATCISGNIQVRGGWGFMAGDEASAAFVGHRALRASLLVQDGFAPTSKLALALMSTFKNNAQEAALFAAHASPKKFGELAPLVIEFYARGDWIAKDIVSMCTRYLEAAMASACSEGADRFCLHGGLSQIWTPLLNPKWQGRLVSPLADAAEGAVLGAMQCDNAQLSKTVSF